MAIPAANGQIYQMTLKGTLDSQEILSIYNYVLLDLSGPGTTTKAVSDFLHAQLSVPDGGGKRFDSTYLAMLPPQYAWLYTWVQCISPTRVRKEIYNETGDGTNPADGHWANSAACITRRSDLAGRSQISTLHVPIPSELGAAAGILPGDYITAMNDHCQQIIRTQANAGGAYNLYPVILHRGTPITYDRITNAISQSTVRVMRRRTVGLGS